MLAVPLSSAGVSVSGKSEESVGVGSGFARSPLASARASCTVPEAENSSTVRL